MRFVKMTGIGNDYVYINGFEQTIDDPARHAIAMADRHFGIGSDGLILILPAEQGVQAHVRMRMFNADGSESEMCGNGIRCVCKMVHDHGIGPEPHANPLNIQTGAGVLSVSYEADAVGKVKNATVDMGAPILAPEQVPIDAESLVQTDQPQTYKVSVPGTTQRFNATFVSMGNPHAVIFLDEVDDEHREALLTWGKSLEHHEAFPSRMNIHFVEVLDRDHVRVVHWERGSGPTLACGTGACAVCVAGVLTNRTERDITAHLPGGDLKLSWKDAAESSTGHVFMTGPATEVFTGDWPG
ncbi:MAG: diaminopimelate epimerase [Phycisphaerales bacterium JB063]